MGPGGGQPSNPTRSPPRPNGSGTQGGPSPQNHTLGADIDHSLPSSAQSGIPLWESLCFNLVLATPQIKGSPRATLSPANWGLPPNWPVLGAFVLTPRLQARCLAKGMAFPLGALCKHYWQKQPPTAVYFLEPTPFSVIRRSRQASRPADPTSTRSSPMRPQEEGSPARYKPPSAPRATSPNGGRNSWGGPRPASAHLLVGGWEWATGQTGAAAGLGLGPCRAGPAWTGGGTCGASAATEARNQSGSWTECRSQGGSGTEREAPDRTVREQTQNGVFLSKPGSSEQLGPQPLEDPTASEP